MTADVQAADSSVTTTFFSGKYLLFAFGLVLIESRDFVGILFGDDDALYFSEVWLG